MTQEQTERTEGDLTDLNLTGDQEKDEPVLVNKEEPDFDFDDWDIGGGRKVRKLTQDGRVIEIPGLSEG